MKAGRILLFLASVIGALAVVSFVIPEEGQDIGGMQVQFTSLHELVEARKQSDAPAVDTALYRQMLRTNDSVAYYRNLVNNGELRFWLPEPHYLDSFWKSLEQARRKGRTVRVLHYGDSQIEMDHITSRLRASLQRRFGGSGPGMLPFHTITPVMNASLYTRGALVHLATFGDSLAIRSRGNYGPMMQCFRMSGGSATAIIKPTKIKHADNRVKQLGRVRLITNSRKDISATLYNIKEPKQRQTQTVAAGVTMTEWLPDSNRASGFNVTVNGNADLYALLVDGNGGGVAVDNIPMRGCSGQQFVMVNEKLLTDAYATMDVGMIILQFGGNSVPYLKRSAQISTYCKSIGKQIDYLHQCCPGAKVLFIGPSDMSTRVHGKLQTYPIIPELIDSLAATATKHGAAYWSIYHAMGGQNSMLAWKQQGLAGSDYIHFSQHGADVMGNRLSEAFNNSYKLYKFEQKKHKRTINSKKK